MGKLTDEEIQSILDRDAPGTRIINGPAAFASEPPDAASPDLDELLGRKTEPDDECERSDSAPPNDEGGPDETDGIVAVEPDPPNRWGRGQGPKAAVLSEGRVVGFQG